MRAHTGTWVNDGRLSSDSVHRTRSASHFLHDSEAKHLTSQFQLLSLAFETLYQVPVLTISCCPTLVPFQGYRNAGHPKNPSFAMLASLEFSSL